MNKQKKTLNNESGITLVSLVVTIVVMLILAGVSISMVVGQNGVGTRAQNASIDTKVANIQDALSQAVASANTAYETDHALDHKIKENKTYYTAEKLALEGLDSAKLLDDNIDYYKDYTNITYYTPNSNDGTKAWCKVEVKSSDKITSNTDAVQLIIGTYDTDYKFVIDLKKGKVSVYPSKNVDERTPSNKYTNSTNNAIETDSTITNTTDIGNIKSETNDIP